MIKLKTKSGTLTITLASDDTVERHKWRVFRYYFGSWCLLKYVVFYRLEKAAPMSFTWFIFKGRYRTRRNTYRANRMFILTKI